jgi:hypothetical protein
MTTEEMPVLRTLVKGIIPGLAERGKIKIGEKGKMVRSKSGTEFQPPKKLDHFRVTTLERDADGNFRTDDQIHAMLGGPEPREIPVMLMFDNIERNFSTRYVCYKGKTRWCHGDGENAIRIIDDKGNIASTQCPCERLSMDYKGNTRCKIAGVLSVIIRGAESVGGVWKLRTTSWNTCQSIMSSLALIQQITKGRLAGIPLVLTISPKTATAPDGSSQTIFVVNIEYRGTPESLMDAGYEKLLTNATYAKKLALVEAEAERLIAAELPAAEDAEFVAEFIPEQTETTAQTEKPAPEKRKAATKKQPAPEPEPEDAQDPNDNKPEEPEGTESEDAAPDGAQVFGTDGEDPDNDVF